MNKSHTHINNRLFKLDVQAVAGHGDDGIFRPAHVLRKLSMQLWEGHLQQMIISETYIQHTSAEKDHS